MKKTTAHDPAELGLREYPPTEDIPAVAYSIEDPTNRKIYMTTVGLGSVSIDNTDAVREELERLKATEN